MYKNFISWKSYFLDDQKIDYNLTETNKIKLFNTNDLNMKGDYQINYLNKYLGELVMMYYIWKNNLKSDYILISQYRKDISHINFDMLSENKVQVYFLWNEKYPFNPIEKLFSLDFHDPGNVLKQKFIEYLDIQTIYDRSIVNKLKNEYVLTPRIACLVFAMKWEIYCQLCEFIFGYLDYILPNEQWKNVDTLLKLRDDQYKLYLNKYEDNEEDWNILREPRYLVWIIEDIIGTCISSLYDVYYEFIYIKYNLLCFSNDIDKIVRFYTLNKKINTEHIYVVVDNEHYNYICENLYNTPWREYVFPNLRILKETEYRIIKFINGNNLIELNENEYLDINDIYSIYNMSKKEILKYKKKINK